MSFYFINNLLTTPAKIKAINIAIIVLVDNSTDTLTDPFPEIISYNV